MAEKISTGAVIGIVVGGILLLILVSIVYPFVSEFIGIFTGGFDSQTKSSFDRLVTTINSLEDQENKVIPIWIKKKSYIVGFGSSIDKVPGDVKCSDGYGFVDVGYDIMKPCDNVCLCLCERGSSDKINCKSKNCVDFEVDLDGECNTYIVLSGISGIMGGQKNWYNLELRRFGNVVEIGGVSE